MNKKLVMIMSSIYVIFMAFVSIFYYMHGDSYKGIVAIGGVLCGAIPLLLSLFTRLTLNIPITISYFIFIFGAQYLGTILNWYGLGWWDTFIHFISGGILANIAIALHKRWIHPSNTISPWFIFFFALSFATLCGVIWEIYEFTFDQLFNMDLQQDNTDTMTDLSADTLGGFVIAVWAGFQAKRKSKQHPSTHINM